MTMLCPDCGDELVQSVASDLEVWTCLSCGWRKRDMLGSNCCGASYHVNNDGGVTRFFVCDACGGACDPKVETRVDRAVTGA